MKQEIRRYPDLQVLSGDAARFISERAGECVKEQGYFTLVLAGGGTPRLLYGYLAQPSCKTVIPWRRTHLFWGDERCVPPDHRDSNYAMAYRLLISMVDIPPENIHRVPAEMESSPAAAETYGKILRDFITVRQSCSAEENRFPRFDMILLGLGQDGHTASLFPGDPVLEEKKLWVASVNAPPGISPKKRITLTLPVINRADCILFLVSGSGKKNVLESVSNDPDKAVLLYPAARIRPAGRLMWFIDEGGILENS